METTEDKLFSAVSSDDQKLVVRLLSEDADPNKIVPSQGRTCLGEAARIGNISILKLLLNASQPLFNKANNCKILSLKKAFKRKFKAENVVTSCTDRAKKECHSKLGKDANDSLVKEGTNQGYFVFIHNEEGASSDDTKIGTESSASSGSLTPSPQGDLEWDEETTNVAPSTSEDDSWTAMYRWYASILESSGAALASATSMKNGIDQQDTHTRTALHYAAGNGHLDAVRLLIGARCKLDIGCRLGRTPLHCAVIENKIEVAKYLLAMGSCVNYETLDNMTPLHIAAALGFLEMAKLLVLKGARLEARNVRERTPLYLAAGYGHSEVVKYLISAGSNVNSTDVYGFTPLCEAVCQKFASVVQVLLLSGARVTPRNKLLHIAIIQKEVDIVKMLAAVGGGLNLCNENGDTPLILAMRMSQMDIIEMLLRRGANVNARNSITGASVLHAAVESVEEPAVLEELLTLLLQHGLDMNSTALTGDTALNRALLLNKDHAAKLLIRYGADVNTVDYFSCGIDNLEIASRRQSSSLVELLLQAGHESHSIQLHSPPLTSTSTITRLFELCRQPLSLLDLCRIKIRRSCNVNNALMTNLSLLPLPGRLKKYLLMETE